MSETAPTNPVRVAKPGISPARPSIRGVSPLCAGQTFFYVRYFRFLFFSSSPRRGGNLVVDRKGGRKTLAQSQKYRPFRLTMGTRRAAPTNRSHDARAVFDQLRWLVYCGLSLRGKGYDIRRSTVCIRGKKKGIFQSRTLQKIAWFVTGRGRCAFTKMLYFCVGEKKRKGR